MTKKQEISVTFLLFFILLMLPFSVMKTSTPSAKNKSRTTTRSGASVSEVPEARPRRISAPVPQAPDATPNTYSEAEKEKETFMASTTATPVVNGFKAASEVLVVPGASLALDGDLKDAGLHLAGAVVARLVFGPIGWLAFAADSYAKSTTGKGLYQHITNS
jgi:hypothetical protein